MHSNSIASRIDRGELGQVVHVAVTRDDHDAGGIDVRVHVVVLVASVVDGGDIVM